MVVLGTLAVLGSLLRVYLFQEPYETVVVAACILCASALVLDTLWLVGFSVVSALAWFGIASNALPTENLLFATGGLAGSIGLGIWIQRLRQTDQEALQKQRETRENAARSLALRHDRFVKSLAGANVGHWYWDLKSDRFYVSPTWAEGIGLNALDCSNKSPDLWFDRVHHYYVAELRQALASHLHGQTSSFECQFRIQHRDGTYRWMLARGVAQRNQEGEPVSVAGGQADVTHLIGAENKILNEALHDKLTGLPNRQAFMIRLERAVENQTHDPSARFAVIFLDLDRFKVINDSLGHLVGDQLLVVMARRLRDSLKTSDVVARFGGDEFVALLEGIRAPEDAIAVAERFREVLAKPARIGSQEVVSGGSVGIALSNPEISNAEDLLRNADTAMYQAKAGSKGKVSVFNDDMHSQAMHVCRLQNDLAQAVDRDELELYYQPIFDVRSGRISAVEALLRWRRDEDTFVPPSDFVPLAEEMGLIEAVGEWALKTACQQNSAWFRKGLSPIRVAVNLSARQLRDKSFPNTVSQILEAADLPTKYLELELTESALMSSIDAAPGLLDQIRETGVGISIDDFGTGYSALSYLQEHRFEKSKDRPIISGRARQRGQQRCRRARSYRSRSQPQHQSGRRGPRTRGPTANPPPAQLRLHTGIPRRTADGRRPHRRAVSPALDAGSSGGNGRG